MASNRRTPIILSIMLMDKHFHSTDRWEQCHDFILKKKLIQGNIQGFSMPPHGQTNSEHYAKTKYIV